LRQPLTAPPRQTRQGVHAIFNMMSMARPSHNKTLMLNGLAYQRQSKYTQKRFIVSAPDINRIIKINIEPFFTPKIGNFIN